MVSVPKDPKQKSWYEHLPKGNVEQPGKVRNPFREAVEAARKTTQAYHGFPKPTPNHPSQEGAKRRKTWAETYKRNAPTLDKNEIDDPSRVMQRRNKRKGS